MLRASASASAIGNRARACQSRLRGAGGRRRGAAVRSDRIARGKRRGQFSSGRGLLRRNAGGEAFSGRRACGVGPAVLSCLAPACLVGSRSCSSRGAWGLCEQRLESASCRRRAETGSRRARIGLERRLRERQGRSGAGGDFEAPCLSLRQNMLGIESGGRDLASRAGTGRNGRCGARRLRPPPCSCPRGETWRETRLRLQRPRRFRRLRELREICVGLRLP